MPPVFVISPSGETVNASDLKSAALMGLGVQVPWRAPFAYVGENKLIEKNKMRAKRRHEKQRAIARTRAHFLMRSWNEIENLTYYVTRHADNEARCSCAMCGNPRKWGGEKTIQEMRFSFSFVEE